MQQPLIAVRDKKVKPLSILWWLAYCHKCVTVLNVHVPCSMYCVHVALQTQMA